MILSIKFLQVCEKYNGAGAGAGTAITSCGSGSGGQFNFGSLASAPQHSTQTHTELQTKMPEITLKSVLFNKADIHDWFLYDNR